jgi:bile acid:Na+ symporter, BASS family
MESPRNQVTVIVEVIHRHFIWVILTSYVVAAALPGLGIWIRNTNLGEAPAQGSGLVFSLPVLMLATLLFNAGLGVNTEELRHLVQRPLVLLGGVAGNLATPLTFILVLSLAMASWHNADEVQQILVGLAIVASMPIAGSSTAWAQNANGNLSLSLGLILLTTVLSPLLTPLVLHTVGFVTTGDYSEDLHGLASGGVGTFLGTWVILPSMLGIGTRWFAGSQRITAAKPYIKLINYFVLVMLNYSNASLTLPQAVARPDPDLLAVILLITVALSVSTFAAGYLLGHIFRVSRDAMVSLMFGLGMNNNGTGLVLASMALANHPQVMLPIIFYNLVQHLVASFVDFAMFRQKPRAQAGTAIPALNAGRHRPTDLSDPQS